MDDRIEDGFAKGGFGYRECLYTLNTLVADARLQVLGQ